MNNKQVGLQSVALALILAPEPFTTIPGVILLAVAKAAGSKTNVTQRPSARFEDYYSSKVELKDNGRVSYGVAPKPGREGLPHSLPKTTKLYETGSWKNYRQKAYGYLDKKAPDFKGVQRGLLDDVNRGLNHKNY
jgi:hypothetical protein